jgi:hypothetical protein
VYSCYVIDGKRWYEVAIPVYLVLVVSLILSRENKARPDEQKDQLTFGRSLCISSAIITLVVVSGQVEDTFSFDLNYGTCLAQICVFIIYVWARNKAPLETTDFNFVQLALITTTFLVNAGWAITQYGGSKSGTSTEHHFLIVALALYLLWFICTCFWLRHLGRLISVQRPSQSSV